MFGFPPAARAVCWLNAWIAGRVPSDDVITGLVGDDVSVRFIATPDGEVLSPALLLPVLRQLRVSRVSLSLPRPGLLLGLGGPPAFNADAVEAGEAMLWHGADVGYVPRWVGPALDWHGATAAAPTYLPDVATADREMRAAVTSAAGRLAELDVARWNPDIADALINLRSPRSFGPPLPFASPPAAELAATAVRCLTIADLAGSDDGAAVSAAEINARREVLTELGDAARTALVAACSQLG